MTEAERLLAEVRRTAQRRDNVKQQIDRALAVWAKNPCPATRQPLDWAIQEYPGAFLDVEQAKANWREYEQAAIVDAASRTGRD